MPVKPTEGVILKEADGDAFLLHVECGRYFGLNRSGLVIWQALTAGRDPVAALGERWPDVPRERFQADADALLGSLRDAGLVADAPSAGS